MKKLLKAVVGGVALLVMAGSVQAAPAINLGTLTPGAILLGPFDAKSGTFSDDYTFDVQSGPLPTVAGGVFFNFGGTFSALNLHFGSSTIDLLGLGSGNGTSLGHLTDGSYSFTVTGTTQTATAHYAAQVSAVPEPNVVALMLLGLGMIGFTLRTRSRRDSHNRM